jgi:hypothetical protein
VAHKLLREVVKGGGMVVGGGGRKKMPPPTRVSSEGEARVVNGGRWW